MSVDENEFQDFSSNISGLPKNKISWKKLIIIGAVSIVLIVAIIIIIVILTSSSSSEKSQNYETLGIINCTYAIQSTSVETKILGDEFQKDSKFDIFIDGENIKYTKSYKFPSIKQYQIQIKLYEPLKMDYLFNNIESLISVKMNSENNLKILSMESAFSNCENLETFNITGFNIEEVKSTKKLFFNTKLDKINF